MEYTLEGHGYSIARVMRNALHAQGLSGPELQFADPIIAQIDSLPGYPPPDLTAVARTLGEVWRTARSRTPAGRSRPPESARAGAEGSNGGDFTVETPPELLAMLRALLPHGPMEGVAYRAAAAAKAVFDKLGLELGEGPQVSLCSLEKSLHGDEHLRIGAHWPTRYGDIRPGDPVTCGVLIVLHRDRTGGYTLEALPRVHRPVCQSGMVMPCKNATIHKVDPRLLFGSDDLSPLTAALEQATHASLDNTVFERAVDRCRRSANEVTGPSATPLASLLESRLRPQAILAVHRRYAMTHDFTRWGMINAVTSEARTAPAGLMLILERLGGELADVAPSIPGPRRASSPSIAAVRASLEDVVRRTGTARPPKKVTED